MVNKDIPLWETALAKPSFAVNVGARQRSPVPNMILFFNAIFLVVGRAETRADGLSETTLPKKYVSAPEEDAHPINDDEQGKIIWQKKKHNYGITEEKKTFCGDEGENKQSLSFLWRPTTSRTFFYSGL